MNNKYRLLYNSVCVCVFSSHSFWTSSSLDVPAGVTQQEEGHTGFFIHLPSAVRALIFVARRIEPFLSLVDREVEFCVLSPSVFLFRCVLHPLPLPLSSCLGCISPLIGLPSLRFYAVGSSLFLLSVCFCLCFLLYRDGVLCWLLPCPSFSVCFPCLSPTPGLIWFGSVYLVTTAGFVADQLM